MAYGAPYALTSDGRLANPDCARRADKGAYACLICSEPVFVKRGEVRVPHFAHYSGHDCDPEGVIHEAAKWRLKEALEHGLVEGVLTPCSASLEGCEGHAPLFLALGAGEVFLEHGFNHRRFDVAVTADHKVMLGLEVFYTHRVDEAKQEDLARVPWLELGAHDVLKDATRWRVLNGNLKARCPTCLGLEEAERLREHYESRKVAFALSEDGVVAAEGCSPGTAYQCLVCEGEVRSVGLAGQPLLVHTNLPRCDPHAILVAAALDKLETLLTAHLAAGELKFYKVFSCVGARVGFPRRPCAQRVGLPIVCRYDAFEVGNDAVILSQNGREVFEIALGERRGGMRSYRLEPGAVVRDPLHWPAKRPGGVLCGACSEAKGLKLY